jgi:uncharacterized protein (TIGR02757 family)
MKRAELKQTLDAFVLRYNQKSFIVDDPISVPHEFSKKQDIEVSALLTSIIAWGQRKTIIKNAQNLMQMMDYEPHQFIKHASLSEFKPFLKFVHRTFNGSDCFYFLKSLKRIYTQYHSLGDMMEQWVHEHDFAQTMSRFRKEIFYLEPPARVLKHIGDPLNNSACKRYNMFLRWMIRKDHAGVDFGLWNIPASQLFCPLDVHSGRVARETGLLKRKQDDWKAVEELTFNLRLMDPDDPVKYDFALFGMGVNRDL